MRKLFNLVRCTRSRMEHELEKEMQYHVERRVTDLLNAGIDEADARRQIAIEFGSVTQLKEETRDTWYLRWLHDFGRDVRYSVRMLLGRSPAFTATALLSLALGIGANTAIFTLIDAVLLRLLPVNKPEELVSLNLTELSDRSYRHWVDGNSRTAFPYVTFTQMRAYNQVFSDMLAFKTAGRLNTQVNGEPELAQGQFVTANYFSALGVRMILGRGFTESDDRAGAGTVVVISSGYWHRRFGADTSAIVKTINIKGISLNIVGVRAPEFYGLQPGATIDLTAPLSILPQVLPDFFPPSVPLFTSGDHWWVEIMGRLKPGVTTERARANLEVIFKSSVLNGAAPARGGKPITLPALQIVPASHGLDGLRRQFSKPLFILMTV